MNDFLDSAGSAPFSLVESNPAAAWAPALLHGIFCQRLISVFRANSSFLLWILPIALAIATLSDADIELPATRRLRVYKAESREPCEFLALALSLLTVSLSGSDIF